MLAVDGVWGDRTPGGGIGLAFGRSVVVDKFLRSYRPREDLLEEGWGFGLDGEKNLECRFKISRKALICGGQNSATSSWKPLVEPIRAHKKRKYLSG